MKEIILLANDPGGYDVILPVYNELKNRGDISAILLLTGQAGNKLPEYKAEQDEVIQYIKTRLESQDKFILITGTSWNSTVELEAIHLCKKSGIKTISILDYWSNYKARFKYGEDYIFPDYFLVMDELAFNEAEKDGIDPSIMKIVGTPGLDRFFNMEKNKKKVLFLSQPLSALTVNSNDGYNEFDAFEGVVKACKELGMDSFIKFHPKETDNMKELYKSKQVEGQLEDMISDYDVIVGMNTMGLLHCSLMGIPVISYQPNLRTADKCIINKLGIVKGAFTYEELLEQLKSITSSMDNCELPFWYDGKSTDRCVNKILSIYDE